MAIVGDDELIGRQMDLDRVLRHVEAVDPELGGPKACPIRVACYTMKLGHDMGNKQLMVIETYEII